MPRIFLSYRRQDSAGVAGRIYDRLSAHFGSDAVFMDIDSIPFGDDFREHVDSALGRCDVVVAVIGPGWSGKIDASRRIDDPKDFVRIEIEAALQRRLPVIPVLIDRATMPGEADLPPSLAGLAYRNAIDVDQGRDFPHHVERLIGSIESHLHRRVVTTAASSKTEDASPEPKPAPRQPRRDRRESTYLGDGPSRLNWAGEFGSWVSSHLRIALRLVAPAVLAVLLVALVAFLSTRGRKTPAGEGGLAVGRQSTKVPEPPGPIETVKSVASPTSEPPTDAGRNHPSTNMATPRSSETVAATATRVKEIFRAHCLECHGGSKTNGGVKILDRELLVKKEKIVPGQPEESVLFLLVTAEDETAMPPPGQPRLSSGETDLIQTWIAQGASPFPADVPAPAETNKDLAFQSVVGVDYVLKAILQDTRSLTPQDRRFARYFSLNHLLTGGSTADELDLHRDALAKTINHLTWEHKLAHPQPIEPSKTVFRIDLRVLGWDQQPFKIVRDQNEVPTEQSPVNLFDLVLLEYPYATIYEASETFDRLANEFLVPAGQVRPIPYIRADWFVSVATQPPLYEDILGLPIALKELEKRLGVDADADLDSSRARRAGLAVSGVSRNNRALERHPARYGAYWKSFDFRTSVAAENLFRDPIQLNPAGGEFIFNLPNGLQGYFLANAKGDRLELAPTEIVTDKFAADQTVRNGLSCIRCHDAGMKGFADAVRPAVIPLPDSPGFDKARVLQLYPEQAEMDAVLKEDTDRFNKALLAVLGRQPAREPLIPVSQRFLNGPLSLAKVAAELGSPDPGRLRPILESPSFTNLGLAPLASQGVVRRDTWENAYDQVVRRLGLGVPVIPIDGLTRRDFHPDQSEIDVELKTNKPNNIFAPGDKMFMTVANRSSKAVYIELIGTSSQGKIALLTPSSTKVAPGQKFRHPAEGFLEIQNKELGKEEITVFASETDFPPGLLLRGRDVADRFVHPFHTFQKGGERDGLQIEKTRLLKKTTTIETR